MGWSSSRECQSDPCQSNYQMNEFRIEVKVHIPRRQEYYQQFLYLKSFILRTFPNARIEVIDQESYQGDTEFFEVFVEKELIHSKRGGDGFVDNSNSKDFLEKIEGILENRN